MFNFVITLSRKQKTGIFLGIDLALIPLARSKNVLRAYVQSFLAAVFA